MIVRARAGLLLLAVTGMILATTVPATAASPPLVPGESTGDDPDEEWWEGIVVPETGVLPDGEVHPSLYFTADDIPELRARAAGEVPDPHDFYAGNWDRIRADADAWLGEAVSDNDDDKTRAAKALAFAWIITGDVAYRDHAVATLSAAYENMQETDQYVAMQMTNYAVAYDWVMAEGVADVEPVSEADDLAMRAAIKRGATWMHSYLDRDSVRSHNHRSKVGAAQGSWAMAFADDPDAQAYLDKGMANLHRVWSYMFTEDGIHRDGAGYYWIFTVINSTPFLWHYANAAGEDLFDELQPAFEWQLKTSNPKGWTPNVEDGWYKHTWLATVASAYADTPTELSDTASLGELFQWRFFATDDEPVRYPDDFTGARNQYYGWPDEFVLYDSALDEVQPDADTGTIDFDAGPRGGATVFRSDWDFAQPHTRWAYFEGTAMSNNHDHADALQFLIEAENTILANDNGFGPQRFSGRNEFKGAEHHNVITADGAALGDPEPTEHFLDTAFFDFAEKSAAYFDDQDASHTRALAFPGQDYFIVADHLTAPTDKAWVSRYHNRGELTGAGSRWRWTTDEGPWGDAAHMHAFVLPRDADVGTASDRFNPYGDGNNQAGSQYPDPSTDVEDVTKLELTQTGTDAAYLKVLVPGAVGGLATAFTDLSDGDVLAAAVETADGDDTFLSLADPASAVAGSLAATASFAWTRSVSDDLRQIAGRDLTSLAHDGTEVVTTDVPISFALDVSDPRRHTGQVARDTEGPVTLRLRLPDSRTPSGATLDRAEPERLPVAPEGLAATTADGRVDLHWDAVPTAYDYDVVRTTDGAESERVTTVDSPRFTDTDVTNGTTYEYRVVARNERGESQPSAAVEVTPGPRAPAAPTGLMATPHDSAVSLGWNRAVDADRYLVQRSEVAGGPYETVATVADTTYRDEGLDNDTTYHYVVVAENDAGSGDASDEVSATPFTTPPDAPAGVRSGRGPGEASLSWEEARRARAYDVQRSTTPGGPYTTVAEDLTETEFVDRDVEDGTNYYYYVVVATNSAGASDASREAVAIPGCTPAYTVDGTTENFIEAERYAELTGEFEHHEDPERSGGEYLQSQGADGAGSAPNGDDQVRFDLEVSEGGSYRVWLLAQGDDSSSDSFWIQVDGQDPFQAITHNSRQWSWKTAASSAQLEGGFHTLTIHHRENGARIDKVLLTRDTSYTPEGLGEDALDPARCLDECPETYPIAADERTFIEAERFTELSGDMHVIQDVERSAGAYVQAGPDAPKMDPDTDAWVAYDLDVAEGGEFRIVALSYGPDSNSDSFYVALDDDPPAAQINLPRQWDWKPSSDRVTIPEGEVRLYLKARKAGSNVDKLLLTTDGHTPTGHGDDALPARGCPDDGEPEPQPPASPTGLSASRGPGAVELRWDPTEDADTYDVVRTDRYGGAFTTVAEGLETTGFTDTTGEEGTAYTYAVAASNDDGTSRRSVTVTADPGCTATYQLGSDAPVRIEAERSSARAGDILDVEDEDRSGGAYIQVDEDATKGDAAGDWIRYDLEVEEAGSYEVWTLGSGSSGASNSFHLQVDGEQAALADLDVGDWGWRNPATLELTEGAHSLWLRNREPGAAMDQLLITADDEFHPTAVEAADVPVGCGPCPIPDARDTVVLRGLDSGVDNRDTGDGCTINDVIDDTGEWDSHGAFVEHVDEVTEDLLEAGVIDGRERGAIVRTAARTGKENR